MNIKKIAYIVLGYIGVALGAVGAIVPLLPAFPFLLLATFCFAKSSEKLHNWFISTKLYKNNLETATLPSSPCCVSVVFSARHNLPICVHDVLYCHHNR